MKILKEHKKKQIRNGNNGEEDKMKHNNIEEYFIYESIIEYYSIIHYFLIYIHFKDFLFLELDKDHLFYFSKLSKKFYLKYIFVVKTGKTNL